MTPQDRHTTVVKDEPDRVLSQSGAPAADQRCFLTAADMAACSAPVTPPESAADTVTDILPKKQVLT